MLTTGMDNHARPGMACSECNDLLVAPKSSAYVSNHEVRHVWSCENCGHEIEMAVTLRFDNHAGTERRSIFAWSQL
jgi:RNase P subunit RPR2